jgi:hypothetical protein
MVGLDDRLEGDTLAASTPASLSPRWPAIKLEMYTNRIILNSPEQLVRGLSHNMSSFVDVVDAFTPETLCYEQR